MVVIVWLIVLRSLVLLVFDSDSVCGWSCRCVVLDLRWVCCFAGVNVFRLEFAYHFVFGCWFGRFVLPLGLRCVVCVVDCWLFDWFVGCCMIRWLFYCI